MADIMLTIIIPAYNEERNIASTLREVAGYLKLRKFSYEVIVVDDGSRDGTYEAAASQAAIFENFKVLKNGLNKGKGYSVKRGMLRGQGKYLVFMDADNSTSIYEFDKFLPFLGEGYDAVIASRRSEGAVIEMPQPIPRAIMGQFYIFLGRLILGLKVNDINCGFKAYRIQAARLLYDKQKMDDWSFDAELLFLAHKYGLKLKVVPIRWVHKSTSKVRPLQDAIKSFYSLLEIRINDLRRQYEK